MSKLNKYEDWEIHSAVNDHVTFSKTLNIDTVYDRGKFIEGLERLFYENKVKKLLVGIILGMLA